MGRGFWIIASAFVLLFATISSARAQPNLAALLTGAREQVSRDLEAGFQAGLIRERRLADDRQASEMARLEGLVRTLRQRAARAGGDAAQARRELVAARAEFARLTADIAGRESSLRAQLNAYRVEAGRIAFTADPAKLAALQQFADGDRVGAWPVLEELTQAENRAGLRAAHAIAGERSAQLAALREVMRDRGEATAADVLAIWTQVVTLDPDNFEGQLERARLALLVGRYAEAEAAGQAGLRVASTLEERWRANSRLADTATTRPRRKGYAEAAVPLARQLVDGNPASVPFQQQLARSLSQLGTQGAWDDLVAARGHFDESLAILRRLVTADPTSIVLREDLAEALNDAGRLLNDFNDAPGSLATFEEQVAVARAVIRDAPGSLRHRHALAQALRSYSALLIDAQRFDDARRALDEMLAIALGLRRADQTSLLYRSDVADAYYNLGHLEVRRGEEQAAVGFFDRAVEARPDRDTRTALASAYERVGDLANARRILEELAASYGEDPQGYAALFSLGRVLLSQGDFEAAAAQFTRSVTGARALAARRYSPNTQLNLSLSLQGGGWAQLRLDNREAARARYFESYELLKELIRRVPSFLEFPGNRRDVYEKLALSAYNVALLDGSIPWPEVTGYYVVLRETRPLSPSEEARLATAQERSAAQ